MMSYDGVNLIFSIMSKSRTPRVRALFVTPAVRRIIETALNTNISRHERLMDDDVRGMDVALAVLMCLRNSITSL